MTVKQLKEKLSELPDDRDVFIEKWNDEFNLSLSEHIGLREAVFSEGGSSKVKATDIVVVISDQP